MRGATLAYMTMGLIAVSPLHIAGIVEKKTDENFRKTAQTTFILPKILSVPFFSCFRNYRLRLLSFWRHLLQGVVGGFDSFLFAVHCCDVFFFGHVSLFGTTAFFLMRKSALSVGVFFFLSGWLLMQKRATKRADRAASCFCYAMFSFFPV